jgi:EAL domain-containing protein (putative c-di-GMP-specific phosphodiesterase class I)/ActR/RegA family two-component response regulator
VTDSTLTHRLLVIDDDESVAELLGDIAFGHGFAADVANTSADIDRLAGSGHDLVLLDLTLGDTDGLQVMRLLRKRQPGVALILLTGADRTVLTSAQRVAELSGFRVIGACSKPVDIDELGELFESSKQAVIKDDTGAIRRLSDVARQALDEGQVHLVYQPKMDLATRRITGAEALVRLSVAGFEDVSPGAWVPFVEDAGRSRQLLDLVLRTAAADRLRVPALAALQDISVNLSVLDLHDLELPDRIREVLTATCEAGRWTLEITESAETGQLTEALDVLTRFRLLGFRLAMDDFGTGTSTFERLRVYPFNELKINRLFVHTDRGGVDHTRAMLRAAVDLGVALELKVVVEGVETEAELALVDEVGCAAVQGYLVSRPMRPDDFESAATAWDRRTAQTA